MVPALWISKSGLDAQQTQVGVISNNLANVNTTGYKRSRPVFEDLLYQNMRQPGGQTSDATELPTGLMLGTGVRITATQKNFQAGTTVSTEAPLDMAINGRGFFQVQQPDGTTAYTRDGNFTQDAQGRLVNSSGYLVQPNITLPNNTTQVTIGVDGTVSANIPGSSTPTNVGQITLADFVNSSGLEPIGNNLYRETVASGAPTITTPGSNGVGEILQSHLESSNVNVVEELVNLIEAQRAYEMNSKAISTVDGMLQYTTQTL